MKKIIIALFVVMFLVAVSGKILVGLVPDEVVRNVGNKTEKDFVDATDTSDFEKSLENIDYDDLEWGYDDSTDWNEDLYQAQGGGVDPQGGFFQKHALMSFVDDSKEVLIQENFFVSHMADIYLNAPSYLGKKIKYEGMFFSQYDEKKGKTYKYVLRYGPGCCAYDDQVGLEIFTDESYEDKTWVSVSGTLREYQGEKFKHLALDDITLEVKEERGQETVLK